MGLKRKRLSSGLVGHWLTDDSDPATAPDHSGNLNHGTIYGATWAAGTVGRALSFDGGDDYIDAGAGASLNITGAISISVWVKPTDGYSDADTVDMQIVNKRGSGAPTAYGIGFSEADGAIRFSRSDNVGGGVLSVVSTITSWDDVWYHIAVTANATTSGILYINGAQDSTADYTGTVTNATGDKVLTIGLDRTAIPLRYFNGLIDDVRIWNRELSADEIKDIYTKGRQRHAI